MYFVYILRCRDGTLYTGYTNNLERRLAAHILARPEDNTREMLLKLAREIQVGGGAAGGAHPPL